MSSGGIERSLATVQTCEKGELSWTLVEPLDI